MSGHEFLMPIHDPEQRSAESERLSQIEMFAEGLSSDVGPLFGRDVARLVRDYRALRERLLIDATENEYMQERDSLIAEVKRWREAADWRTYESTQENPRPLDLMGEPQLRTALALLREDCRALSEALEALRPIPGIARWALRQHLAWIRGVDRMPIGADGIAEVERLLRIVEDAALAMGLLEPGPDPSLSAATSLGGDAS